MAQKFTVPITVKQLSSASSDAITVFVDADTYSRLKVEAGGRLVWGDGTVSGDTNLYRDAANVLKTDDTFKTPILYVDDIEIDTTGATTDQVLKFNGTKFIPGTASTVGAINDLSDVTITSVAVDQILKYNGTAWVNVNDAVAAVTATINVSDTAPVSPGTGDLWFNSLTLETYMYYDGYWLQTSGEADLVEDLADLADVVLTVPVNGQFLKYNGTSWVNGTIPTINTLDDIGDVTITSVSSGEVLKWNGTAWVNAADAAGTTINSLDDIGDVSVVSPSSGQFLKWNGTAWVAQTIVSGATISDTAPASPSAGQLWFQSTNGKTFVYYDSQWIEIGGVGTGARMVSSSSAPASPLEGSMWFDTDTAQTFVYYDSSWIEIGASGVTASVQDTAPASPVSGQIWFNSLTGGTYVYYGTNWIEVGAAPFTSFLNTINAKGDLIVGTADNAIAGLTAGSANQVLTVDSSTATGLKWSTPTVYQAVVSGVSDTEIGYLDGVTSAIQTQLGTKASTGKSIAMAIVFGG